MYPVLLDLGPIKIYSFGLMVALGFLSAYFVTKKSLKRKRINPELVSSMLLSAVIGGIVGARTYFIIEHFSEFVLDPLSFIFTGAGLTWYGGLIGGVGATSYVVIKSKVPFWKVADAVGPAIILGYAIGRIGCLLAGDGDYGPPSDVPWAMAFPNGVVPTDIPVHPTPIYDFILSIVGFFILMKFNKKQLSDGIIFSGSLIAMGLERFITEFWRNTLEVAFGWMTTAQIISIVSIIVGIVMIFIFKQKVKLLKEV